MVPQTASNRTSREGYITRQDWRSSLSAEKCCSRLAIRGLSTTSASTAASESCRGQGNHHPSQSGTVVNPNSSPSEIPRPIDNSHAHQFKRAGRALRFLRTRLGRDPRHHRKIRGQPELITRFAPLLDLAIKLRHQDHRQRGPKVYSLHAPPEVECIGKGKARAPYEFGCKVSIATPVTTPKGGQFVLHAKALHGNPFDGHTLGPAVKDLEPVTGVETRRINVDKGHRGHNHPEKFRVWISGQARRVTAVIKREMKRRAAVEPVIGHLKAEHRMGRNYLKGRNGDRINAVLAAAGYNFHLLLRWFNAPLRALLHILALSHRQPAVA
jgi:IS5 family transposase